MNDIKPMDPEFVWELRSCIEGYVEPATRMHNVPVRSWMFADLLGVFESHDFHEQRAVRAEQELDTARAEVARLRARVGITEEDVKQAGILQEHIEAWMRANGCEAQPFGYGWLSFVASNGEYFDVWMDAWKEPLTKAIRGLALLTKCSQLDLLDEIAALGKFPPEAVV